MFEFEFLIEIDIRSEKECSIPEGFKNNPSVIQLKIILSISDLIDDTTSWDIVSTFLGKFFELLEYF